MENGEWIIRTLQGTAAGRSVFVCNEVEKTAARSGGIFRESAEELVPVLVLFELSLYISFGVLLYDHTALWASPGEVKCTSADIFKNFIAESVEFKVFVFHHFFSPFSLLQYAEFPLAVSIYAGEGKMQQKFFRP